MELTSVDLDTVHGPDAFVAADGETFLADMDRVLALLRHSGIRVSLFALTFDGIPRGTIPPVVARAVDPIGFAGLLPDGRTAVLYIGPRPSGTGDRPVWSAIRARLIPALAEAGLGEIATLAEAHAAAGSIRTTRDLVRLLVPSHVWG